MAKGKKHSSGKKSTISSKTDHYRTVIRSGDVHVIVPPKGYLVFLGNRTTQDTLFFEVEHVSFSQGKVVIKSLRKQTIITPDYQQYGSEMKIPLVTGQVIHYTVKRDGNSDEKYRLVISLRDEHGRRIKNPRYHSHSRKKRNQSYVDRLVKGVARVRYQKNNPIEGVKVVPDDVYASQYKIAEWEFLEYRKKSTKDFDEKEAKSIFQRLVQDAVKSWNDKEPKSHKHLEDPATMDQKTFERVLNLNLTRLYKTVTHKNDPNRSDYHRSVDASTEKYVRDKVNALWKAYYGDQNKDLPATIDAFFQSHDHAQRSQSSAVVPLALAPKGVDATPKSPIEANSSSASFRSNRQPLTSTRTRDTTF